jgi:hypothetical protein
MTVRLPRRISMQVSVYRAASAPARVVEVVEGADKPAKGAVVHVFKSETAYPVDPFVKRTGSTDARGAVGFTDLPVGG